MLTVIGSRGTHGSSSGPGPIAPSSQALGSRHFADSVAPTDPYPSSRRRFAEDSGVNLEQIGISSLIAGVTNRLRRLTSVLVLPCCGRVTLLAALMIVTIAAPPARASSWDTGTSHNLFVQAAIDDRWFITSRNNLATRDGLNDLFFGYLDVNLGYRLNKAWSVEGGYRQAWLDTPRGTRPEQRPLFNLTWRRAVDEWFLANRSRVELRFFHGSAASDRVRYRNESRVLLPKRLTPPGLRLFLEEEFFYEFDGNGFNTNWLTGGVSFALGHGAALKLGYRWQAQKFGGEWRNRHVLVTGLIWRR